MSEEEMQQAVDDFITAIQTLPVPEEFVVPEEWFA